MAIQIPSNHDHFTHRLIRNLASESPYKEALNSWVRPLTVLKIEDYGKIFLKMVLVIFVSSKKYTHTSFQMQMLYMNGHQEQH